MTISTGVRYDMFTDTRSPKTIGYEVTLPVGFIYSRWDNRLRLSVDTAFSSANVYPGDDPDAELSNLIDTFFSASYLLTTRRAGIIFGLDLNLPTGKEQFSAAQKTAEAGQNNDLFEVDDFGEGFNLGLSLGLVKVVGKFSLSLNGGYWFNGEYDPTQDIDDDDLDPGDRVRAAAQLKWRMSRWLDLDASMTYAHFSEDKTNGEETFQEGDKFTFGGTMHIHTRLWKPVSLVAGFQQTLQGRNKVFSLEKRLEKEPKNSNDQEFFGVLDLLYHHSSRLTFRVLGDLRYYGESERKDTVKELPYEGRRIRYAFGPGVIYKPNTRLGLNGLIKYFFLNQDRDILLDQDTTFRGVNLSVGLTYTF